MGKLTDEFMLAAGVAIETSHIRLEFVTRGNKTRGRRGGCVEGSLEGYQRWSHLQHNINAMFYFFSIAPRSQ